MKYLKAKNKDCVIYLRKSRNDENFDCQRESCQAEANRKGLIVRRTIKDNQSGYVSLLDRAGMTELMEFCKKNNIGHVVVNDVSRLSRNLMDGIFIWQWFVNQGIIIDIVNKSNKYKLPAYFNVIGDLMTAEHEYLEFIKIIEETQIKLEDDDLFKGRAPLGYVLKNKILLKDREQGKNLDKIFHCLLGYAKDKQKVSYAEMYRYLLDNAGTCKDFVKERLPNSKALMRVVQNPKYTGYASYKDKTGKGNNTLPRIATEAKHYKYISIEQYNTLNRGVRELTGTPLKLVKPVRKKYRESYAGEIKCHACGSKLIMNRKRFRCNRCKVSVPIPRISDSIADECMHYRINPEIRFCGTFIRVGRISGLRTIFERIRREIIRQKDNSALGRGNNDSKISIIEDEGWRLQEYLDDLVEIMKKIKDSDEMAVALKIHQSMQREKEFLVTYTQNASYDFNNNRISFVPKDPYERRPDFDYPDTAKIEEESLLYITSYKEFLVKLKEHPVLPAILTFEKGIVTGDYWKDFIEAFGI